MHDVTIRSALPFDVPAIASLNGELGYPTTPEEMRPRVEAILALPDEHALLVAIVDSDVAGWIQVSLVATIESGTFAEIRGLVVSGTHRSLGIGARLVDAAEEWARSRGMTRIRVRSNVVRVRTHAFYEGLGYGLKKEQKVFDKLLGG
jgi:GNAT superfamily N-acetyltransferase